MTGIFNRKQPSVHVRDLSDSKLRATAEMIDDRIGSKNDDTITKSDVDRARHALGRANKDVFSDLSQFELKLLRENLDKLETKLDFADTTNGPFATSIALTAIIDDELRKCGTAVAAQYGTGPAELNLTELRQAKAALEAGEIPETSDIKAAALDEIELFMLTGKGGLVTVRDVNINGQRFDEAFPLPGNPDVADDIRNFDMQLENSGYDRIYFKGPDQKLYVALNGAGKVKAQAGMRVQMGQAGAYRDSGVVLAVVDINNSFSEATIGFWTGLIDRLLKSIRGKLSAKMDAKVNEATDKAVQSFENQSTAAAVAEQGAKDAADTAKSAVETVAAVTGMQAAKFKVDSLQLKDLFAFSGMIAGAGAAFASVPAALGTVATVGGGMTAVNIYDYARTRSGQNKAPVYQAMGVSVGRDRPIR